MVFILKALASRDHKIGGFYTSYGTGKAKVADLYTTVLIYQNVRRLEITVQNVSSMKILDSAQKIVDNELDVFKL